MILMARKGMTPSTKAVMTPKTPVNSTDKAVNRFRPYPSMIAPMKVQPRERQNGDTIRERKNETAV